MSDTEEISKVIALVGHIIDDEQWDRLEEVFAVDGTFELATGAAYEGIDAIRGLFLEFAHPIAHYTTNVVVDVEPDGQRAVAKSKCVNPHRTGQLAIANYDDTLVRTPDGWRLFYRKATIRARWPETPIGSPAVPPAS
jgi:hypothetical protein